MAEPAEPTAEQISRVMKHLSSLGASKGGVARSKNLSAERRREIAKRAAQARWGNPRKKRKAPLRA